MKRVSNYLKMRVLGALEYAEGDTKLARYKAVSHMTFTDENGKAHRFRPKTIEFWWYYYQKNGVTNHPGRSDKGTTRKVAPEDLLEAIEQVLPSFHGKKHNITEIYRTCIQRGLLQGTLISIGTFRKTVNKFKLLKPVDHTSTKARLAFAKGVSHINSLEQLNNEFTRWIEDTYHIREHSTLGMKPIDRFGLDLNRLRHLAASPFSDELFLLESTRKVRADNTFSFNATRYEAPRDLRNTTITIRHHREGTGFAPVVYQDGARLGEAIKLDMIANDRRPDIEF